MVVIVKLIFKPLGAKNKRKGEKQEKIKKILEKHLPYVFGVLALYELTNPSGVK
jgi:hypothetical protein